MAKHTVDDLNRIYDEGENCDEELFAEMRSNLLLVSGNHYSKKSNSFFNRVRNTQKISETQKLRLTKNHIHKITRYYINSILGKSPGVCVEPQNELELQDKKSAELNQAVWDDAKSRYKLKEVFRDLAHNFVEIGEMCSFMYYDPNGGDIKGFEALVDEQGQPILDEQGQAQQDEEKPVFSGTFIFKNVPGFNLMRSPGAKNMRDSEHHVIREMVPTKELEVAYAGEPDKLKVIGDGDKEEFIVFDTNKQGYSSGNEQTLVRYHFFKKCKSYPKGYFYVSTSRGILEDGELPFGVYPLIWEGFDTYATNPRGYSIVKVARPYQAEINRASSQAATHQISVGDDKIIYQGGTKLAPGALLPGVRGITYQGMAPQILPGRSGDQFLPYIQNQIQEMYAACMIEEVNAESETGQLDAYALLYRSASQQQKFSQYTEKMESFQKQFLMTFLELAKHYYDDDMFIQAAGRSEGINLAEFRSTTPLSFQIKTEEQSEAIDSRLGKQISLNHVLQYVGAQLDQKQIGLILKEMPFLNNKSLFTHLTVDHDNAENDMLQLERGQMPWVSPYADNKVYVDDVTHRMKQSDFRMLQQPIQQMYEQYLSLHEGEISRKEQEKQRAMAGFIPTDGALITVQMQVPDSTSPSGTRQVRIPHGALQWLLQKLQDQGQSVGDFEKMNDGALAEMATRYFGGGPQAQLMAGAQGQSQNGAQGPPPPGAHPNLPASY